MFMNNVFLQNFLIMKANEKIVSVCDIFCWHINNFSCVWQT